MTERFRRSVKRSSLDALYACLPVVIVDEWHE